MRKRKFKVVFSISSVPQTLEKAAQLLDLATAQPQFEKLLSSCAAIVLASALEQGTRTALTHAVQMAEEEDFDEMLLSRLQVSCLLLRVRGVPEVLSHGRLRLSPKADRIISDLVHLRNRLVHVDEPATTQEVEVDEEAEQLKIVAPGWMLRSKPWDSVTIRRGREFQQVVNEYNEEVMGRVAEGIAAGRAVVEKVSSRPH